MVFLKELNMKRILLASLAFLVAVGSVAVAGEANEIAALRDQVNALSERIAALEDGGGDGASWADKIKWGGSFRYRHEMIKMEGVHENHRHRLQAKLGVTASVRENVDVVIQLASGMNGLGSGTSTDATFDNAAATKNINLDLAFVKWVPGDVIVLAGKMSNPFFRPGGTEVIWDDDITPEGIGMAYATPLGDAELFVTAGGVVVDERAQDDAIAVGVQAGLKTEVADGATVIVGGTYYDFGAMKGRAPLVAVGNTVDGAGNYAEDFDLIEGFVQVETTVGDFPVAVFGDYVVNNSSYNNGKAYLIGFAIGKCKAPGSKAFRYDYRRVQANAVVGAVCDSSFVGGGTNGQGHEIGFDYQVATNIKAGVTVFATDAYQNAPNEDYERVQFDIKFRF